MLREIAAEIEYRIDKYSNEQHPSNENNTKAILYYFFFPDPSLTVHLMFLFPSLCSNPFTILSLPHTLKKKVEEENEETDFISPEPSGPNLRAPRQPTRLTFGVVHKLRHFLAPPSLLPTTNAGEMPPHPPSLNFPPYSFP